MLKYVIIYVKEVKMYFFTISSYMLQVEESATLLVCGSPLCIKKNSKKNEFKSVVRDGVIMQGPTTILSVNNRWLILY